MKPLKLINPEREATRQQNELDRIHRTWREWIGINGKSWTPVENPQQKPILITDEVLRRTLYILNPQEKVSMRRRFWWWVSRTLL